MLRAMSRDPAVLVVCERQARKVVALTLGFSALAVAACGWAVSTARASEPDPAAYILTALAVAVAFGVHLYARRYVVSMRLDADAILLRTAGIGLGAGSRELRVALDRLGRRSQHEGKLSLLDAPSVDAPWMTLHVDGYTVPFVIDMQAEHVDARRISGLARAG